MKVLFIHMPTREHAPPNIIPLGPLVLASILNRNGVYARILDLNVHRPKDKTPLAMWDLLTELIDEEYDVFMLSGLITTLAYQEMVVKVLRRKYSSSFIVSGGGLATDIKELLFKWIPGLDAINIGPAEENILKIVLERKRGIYKGTNPANMSEYYHNMDYNLVEVEKYVNNLIWGSSAKNSSSTPFTVKRNINSITSKGCPHKCTFCDRELVGSHKYSMRNVFDLTEEMLNLTANYDLDFIGYLDENATVDLNRLASWLNLVKKHDIDYTNWGTSARLDDIGGKNGIVKTKILHDLNCIYLGFGGESANKRILSLMNKGREIVNNIPEIYDNALINCRDNGIHPNLTWIMGYPTETLSELKDTIRFILHMEDDGLVERKYNNRNLFVATAYPNTALFKRVEGKIMSVYKDMKSYVYSLEDATKLLGKDDNILNYSNISDSTFKEIREYVDKGEIEKILNLED